MALQFTVSIHTLYACSIDRAFKTPMLCDVSKVHTGLGLMPKITHCTDDETWGKIGGSKKVYAAPSLIQKGGFVSMDHVLERIENEYWKIEVDQFQSWMLGFYKFTGEWKTTAISPSQVRVDYTYTLHANTYWFRPLNWLFAHLFWKKYMKHVMQNIELMIQQEEPYKYA